jgi:alpha-glucosidase
MRLYHDIARAFAPERRTLLMSNADGIDNGWCTAPGHPAAHRYPVWWTGDTCAEWRYLRAGVENSVASGIRGLLPYVHEDLGGHHGQPGAEFYARFMQFGAFSPVARIHCTAGVHRYPWAYGADIERIVREAFRLRYRLLPVLYAAAVEAHRTGAPLLRRCDLGWPAHPEAADSTQYLLGDDLLVAPILDPAPAGGPASRTVWIPPGAWQDAWSGRIHRGPALLGVECPLHEYPLFVRRGGILPTIPVRESTGEATWPELVVEAFAPLDDGLQTRTLHEDDGHTTAHERGAAAATDLRLRRTGRTVELASQPRPAAAGIRPAVRELVVRLHLPPGAAAGAVRIDGVPARAEDVAMLAPSGERPSAPLPGPGTPPPPEAGPVVEWRGPRHGDQPWRVEVDWE